MQALSPKELIGLIELDGHTEHPAPEPLLYEFTGQMQAAGVTPPDVNGQGVQEIYLIGSQAMEPKKQW